jgi:hypothetical protein
MAYSDSEFNFSEFMNLWIFGRTSCTGDRSDARPLSTHRTTQYRKTRTHIHASSEIRTRDSSVRGLDRAAIGTGYYSVTGENRNTDLRIEAYNHIRCVCTILC